MITADALARELGCTLADLEDLAGGRSIKASDLFISASAGVLRAYWSKRTGIDYTETVK